MVAVDELQSLIEMAHLLRSPKNAERLLNALAIARGSSLPETPLDEWQRRVNPDACGGSCSSLSSRVHLGFAALGRNGKAGCQEIARSGASSVA